MINKKKKKGFTIVELVIVIVIIGVLAAVLIPTFGSLIKKANESADKQTVYQMNIIVAAESVENGELSVSDVIDILEANGFDTTDLNPTSEDLKFKWDDDNKVVILVRPGENDSFEQIYPVVDGGNTSSNVVDLKKPDPVEVMISTLESGGTVDLSESIELIEPLNIPQGVESTINLNGNTLTISDDVASENFGMTINGSLTVTGGNIAIAESNYTDEDDGYYAPGITVAAADQETGTVAGSLTFNGVTITGNRYYNIDNYGTMSFKDVHYTVNGIDGIRSASDAVLTVTNTDFIVNSGTCIYNEGTAIITGGEFVSSGTSVVPINVQAGTVTITNTKFTEDTKNGEVSVSYASSASSPILISNGEVIMDGVDVSVNSTSYYAFFASNAEVVIKNASKFDRQFLCTGSTTVAIYGGTFYDGSSSVEYAALAEETNIFIGGDFNLTQDTDDNNVGYWKVSK